MSCSSRGKQGAQCGATLFGIKEEHIGKILDAILNHVNSKSEHGPIVWTEVASKVGGIGPESCQRLWKYLAYGQLFAASNREVSKFRREGEPFRFQCADK